MLTHLLYETPSGYALFQRGQIDEIGQEWHQVQSSLTNFAQFGKALKLISFYPFKSANDALENMNDITEGIVHDSLKTFLELNLPKDSNIVLGVLEKSLAGSIKSILKIECESNELVHELGRAVRFHADKVLKPLQEGDLDKAFLGLGHAYSQAKLQYNVHKSDNMIIQAVGMLDQLDKDVNTFSMRVREWYSWHFPELAKLVTDQSVYPLIVKLIGDRSTLSTSSSKLVDSLVDILGDEGKANEILEAAKMSMGTDISMMDLQNVLMFADRVISLLQYRTSLYTYLQSKMHQVAPNLSTLIGEVIGARLIAHAGSLTNLSKYPASTVQILGAEKALFRALKTKANTPKFGLLYHSSFIGKAQGKHKGRMSRMLANKCSMASRMDSFMDSISQDNEEQINGTSSSIRTTQFGELLKTQLESKLAFYEKAKAA